MLLKRDLLERIRSGEVDLVFRRWTRPTVRAGGTLKTQAGTLRIVSMDETAPETVNDTEARRAGFADRAAFLDWLETMKQGPLFHRIGVRFEDA